MTDVEIKFKGSAGDFISAGSQVKEQLSSISQEADRAEHLFKYLAERMVEVFALHEIKDFMEDMAELGTKLERVAKMTGLSTDAIQQLSYAASLTGGSADSAATTVERLEHNMGLAMTGSTQTANAFKSLGVAFQNADGSMRPVQEVLGDIADKFSKTRDGATKTYYATTLMGRGGAELIPVLDQGREGLKKLNDEFEEIGGRIGPKTIDTLEELHHQLLDTKSGMIGAGASIAADFKPAVSVATDYAKHLADGLATIVKLLTDIPDVAYAAGNALGHALARRSGKDQYGGSWSTDMPAGAFGIKNYGTEFGPGYQPDLAQPLPEKADHTARDLAKEQVSFEEQMGQLRIANEKSVLDQKVAMGEINKQQEYAQLLDLSGQEYAVERTALENELNIQDLTVVQKQQINDKLLELDQKYANQRAAIMRQSALEEKHQYDQIFNSIEQASNQMVQGILQGTQTWQQVMARLFDNLAAKFIEDLVVKRALKWAESETEQLLATQAKNAGIMASDAAAGDAGIASMALHAIKAITTDAAETFGGIFAFLSPAMGPAAAGPAAAGAASVAAMVGTVASAAGGYDIPAGVNPITQLHEEEMVLPAHLANTIRGMAGDGGSPNNISVNMNVSALDAKSVINLMNNPSTMRQLAKNLSAYLGNNPSVRGNY